MLDAKAILLAEILYGEDMGFERVTEVETELSAAVEDWLAERGATEMEMVRTGDCLRFQTAISESVLKQGELLEELARLAAAWTKEGLHGRLFLLEHDNGPAFVARFDTGGLRTVSV